MLISLLEMMNKMAATRFSMRIDENLRNWLDEEAQKQDRSASYIAESAIKEMKERYEVRSRVMSEALEEADKGQFISEEKMSEWFYSLGSENELAEPEADIFLKRG